MNNILSPYILFFITLALLSGCAVQLHSVQLNPVGNAGSLNVLTTKYRCPESRNPHDGCIVFERNKIGLITFYLPGSENQNSSCASPSTNRVITKIELSTRGQNGDPLAAKGDFSAAGLVNISALQTDAFLGVNTLNGVLFEAANVNQGRTQVRFLNNNANDYVAGQFTPFWYRVTVTHCNNGNTWVSDPRGDNEGTTW